MASRSGAELVNGTRKRKRLTHEGGCDVSGGELTFYLLRLEIPEWEEVEVDYEDVK